ATFWRSVRFQMELQQSPIDRAKMTFGQVAIIDKLPTHTGELIDSPLEMQVTNGIVLQEGMTLWIEEPSIEGRHTEWRTPLIDNAKERLQLRPEGSGVREEELVCIEIFLDTLLHALQAVALAVGGILMHRDQ